MAASPLPLWGKARSPLTLPPPIHQAHLVGLRPPVHARVPRRCHRILLCLRYARPVGMSRCLPVPVLVLDGTDSPLGVQRGEAARALVPSQALEAPCAVGCSWLLADFTKAPLHDTDAAAAARAAEAAGPAESGKPLPAGPWKTGGPVSHSYRSLDDYGDRYHTVARTHPHKGTGARVF